jgi:sulfur relay (sulfurtransferase) DsrF/TusC family protein
MKPRVLFVVTTDPRVSPKPAEAIRIAAGVGVWQRVEVSIYLRDAAVLALMDEPDDLVDEDNYRRYLPLLGKWGRPVYVQRGASLLAQVHEAPVPFEEITDEQLALQALQSRYVLRF